MWRRVLLGSLLTFLTACGSSPKTEFYVLSANHDSMVQAANANTGPALGIYRITLPGFLDRSEIVTRDNEFEITLGDFAWWADNLAESMTRLIAGELSQNLQSTQVVVSPWDAYRTLDYQTIIHVERFDGPLGGEVVFRGVWSLLDASGQTELVRELFEFKTSAAGSPNVEDSPYRDMVAALSRLTVQLAAQMAKKIGEQATM